MVLRKFTLLTLPLLWVGSDIFRCISSVGFSVDVGLDVTPLTGGIGL